MDKLVKQQACQLFIEQEIEKGLSSGKTTYAIGKEVAEWIQKLFQAKVRPETIEERARRMRMATNVATTSTTGKDNGIEEKPDKPIRDEKGLFQPGTSPGPGRPPKFAVIPDKSHFRTSFTGENEAYTPIEYIEAARRVMGEIDLDPATDAFGQSRIKAKKTYTVKDDGLVQEWIGRVWLNPPYSQPEIMHFITKAVEQLKAGKMIEAIILTNNYTDTAWFHLAEAYSDLICFTKGRIKFEKADGSISQAMNGQAFFYMGTNKSKFDSVFAEFGFIR